VLSAGDKNAIAVVAILGVTYTVAYGSVKEIHEALTRRNAATGADNPRHIDAASGGFVGAPKKRV
jgi:glutamate decarboxylase